MGPNYKKKSPFPNKHVIPSPGVDHFSNQISIFFITDFEDGNQNKLNPTHIIHLRGKIVNISITIECFPFFSAKSKFVGMVMDTVFPRIVFALE